MTMQNTGFEIRLATKEDVVSIQEITQEAFQKYAEMAGLDQSIAALKETPEDILYDMEHKYVFVAFLDKVPVGSVRVELQENNTAYLTRFGVRLDYQNSGIGKALINVVDRFMKQDGVKKIYLHTASKVASLIRFYYARGFYIDSTSKDKGYIRALLMKEYE